MYYARNARFHPPPVLAGSRLSSTDTRPIYAPNPRSGRCTLWRTEVLSGELSPVSLLGRNVLSGEPPPFATRFSREPRPVSLRDHGVLSEHTAPSPFARPSHAPRMRSERPSRARTPTKKFSRNAVQGPSTFPKVRVEGSAERGLHSVKHAGIRTGTERNSRRTRPALTQD